MEELRKLLTEELKAEIEHLSTLEKGSEAHLKAVAAIEKLYGMTIDDLKAELAKDEQLARQELERDKHYLAERTHDEQRYLDEAEYKSRKRDRWANFGLQAALGLGGLGLYTILFLMGIRFEEEGTIRSNFVRNLTSKMPGSIFKK